MADWPTVAAAAIGSLGGVGGAAVGYFAARLQAHAERSRLVTEQAEARRQRRDEIYWSFLDCERRLNSIMAADRRISREEFDRWNDEFDHLFNGVVLFGTPSVTTAAEQLAEAAVRDTSQALIEDRSSDSFEEKAHRAYLKVLPAIRAARSEVKAAMQEDVGAELERRRAT